MRLILALVFAAGPAAAWDFTPDPICTLSQVGPTAVTVTYDAALPLYEIRLTHPDGWPDAAVFRIRFDGPRPLTIATDRHRVDGDTLSVSDTGFGNVLNGLQDNVTATALIGEVVRPIDLSGAAQPVEAFRACPATPLALGPSGA